MNISPASLHSAQQGLHYFDQNSVDYLQLAIKNNQRDTEVGLAKTLEFGLLEPMCTLLLKELKTLRWQRASAVSSQFQPLFERCVMSLNQASRHYLNTVDSSPVQKTRLSDHSSEKQKLAVLGAEHNILLGAQNAKGDRAEAARLDVTIDALCSLGDYHEQVTAPLGKPKNGYFGLFRAFVQSVSQITQGYLASVASSPNAGASQYTTSAQSQSPATSPVTTTRVPTAPMVTPVPADKPVTLMRTSPEPTPVTRQTTTASSLTQVNHNNQSSQLQAAIETFAQGMKTKLPQASQDEEWAVLLDKCLMMPVFDSIMNKMMAVNQQLEASNVAPANKHSLLVSMASADVSAIATASRSMLDAIDASSAPKRENPKSQRIKKALTALTADFITKSDVKSLERTLRHILQVGEFYGHLKARSNTSMSEHFDLLYAFARALQAISQTHLNFSDSTAVNVATVPQSQAAHHGPDSAAGPVLPTDTAPQNTETKTTGNQPPAAEPWSDDQFIEQLLNDQSLDVSIGQGLSADDPEQSLIASLLAEEEPSAYKEPSANENKKPSANDKPSRNNAPTANQKPSDDEVPGLVDPFDQLMAMPIVNDPNLVAEDPALASRKRTWSEDSTTLLSDAEMERIINEEPHPNKLPKMF